MIGRIALALVAVFVVASCSDCGSAKCKEGITFLVADVAGSLARGTQEPLHICFDGACQDVTISRTNAGGTIFLPFDGVAKDTDHDMTVVGAGSMHGEYHGKLVSYVQKPNGNSCPGSCALATVRIGSDGTLTPGVPTVPSASTTTAATSSTG